MPPPTEPDTPKPFAQRPAQVLRNSPLAAAPHMLGLRASRRPQERFVWRRVAALVGSLLLHLLVLLFGITFVSDWQPQGIDTPAKMQARFIELPDLAPPPPPRGEPPRQAGPVHRGHAAGARHSASAAAHRAPRTPAIAAKAVAVAPAKVVAAPVPSPSVPQPAPAPKLQPVPVTNQPPSGSLVKPTLQPPVPPKFQPQPMRAPQPEGNQPMLPPPSLALPTVPTQAQPTVAPPTVALDRVVPDTQAPAIVQAAQVALPAAPPVPALQSVPLPVQAAPQVTLQTALHAPALDASRHLPAVQAPAPVEAQAPSLAAIPQSASVKPGVTPLPKAAVGIATDATLTTLGQPSPVALPPGESTPATGEPSTTPSAADKASNAAAGKAGESAARDVSTAPNATPNGSDDAQPGESNGSTQASDIAAVHGNGPVTSHGLGHATRGEAGKGDTGALPGKPTGAGIASAGASPSSPATPGKVPEFIQLKPSGDTAVMRHNVDGVKYEATRFNPYWTPLGESSVDTALRHAVDKTMVQHTFHLPRGIRIKCSFSPLKLLEQVSLHSMGQIGCGNADPPPPALAQKYYDRLNLSNLPGGSVPAVAPAPSASSAAASHVVLNDDAQCATARVASGPLPPGCAPDGPVVKGYAPAASSSSWVPASDQFH